MELVKRILFFILLVLGHFIGVISPIWSQTKADSNKTKVLNTTTNNATKDSILFTNIKTKMTNKKWSKSIYKLFFKDVYNVNKNKQVVDLEENPFKKYQGSYIAQIVTKQLNVFGATVYDTLRKPKNILEKAGNKLHLSTHQKVIINSFLLFEEGDILDSDILKQNERLLRQQKFLHDARIFVIPNNLEPHKVTILILTQDTWSLMPMGSFSSKDKYSIGLNSTNFLGKAHELSVNYIKNNNARVQKNGLELSHSIPYIKRSLVSAKTTFKHTEPERSLSFMLDRPFRTPQIKYAGAFEMGIFGQNKFDKPRGQDSIFVVPIKFALADIWVGRAFNVFFGSEENRKNSRIVLAGRVRGIDFMKRPNKISYQDSRLNLGSIGLTNRSYVRDVLIYGFGRTEDVPLGYSSTVVFGLDNAELGNRSYLGFNFAYGNYLKSIQKSYLYSTFSFGSYRKNSKNEQGIISIQNNYFSGLIPLKNSQMRQFISFNFTKGINRFNAIGEKLDLSNNGIRGVKSDSLQGIQKIVLNAETVLFSRASIGGFRLAPFCFLDLGSINFNEKSLLKSPIYTGFGFGCRLRNENLTFNTIQIRFGIYPNIPNVQAFKLTFDGEQRLILRDFDISKPEEIRFR